MSIAPLLPPPDAVALLCKRSGQARGPEAVSAAGVLAHALGYLPLALTQAAAYVKSAGKSFAEYLDLFHREQSRLLEQPRPSDYPETVATTWSLSMERARSECPAAAELLRLCAYLSPAPLWTAALRAGASRLSAILAGLGTDEISWDAAVRTLSELALLSAEKGVIWVHQLVQAVTRIRLAPSEQQQYANAALTWSAEMYTAC